MMDKNTVFKEHELVDLEKVLFGNPFDLYKYVLFNSSTKEYYLGETYNASDLISRLRRAVMKCDYRVLPHNLQFVAKTSQMSSWQILLFSKDMSFTVIESRLSNYTRLLKAAPWEVNPREDTRIFEAFNTRYLITVYFSTAIINSSDADLASKAKKATKYCVNRARKQGIGNDFTLETYDAAGEHTATNQWKIHSLPVSEYQGLSPWEIAHIAIKKSDNSFGLFNRISANGSFSRCVNIVSKKSA